MLLTTRLPIWRLLFLVFALFLFGCETTKVSSPDQEVIISKLKSYEVDKIELDYIGLCKIRVKSPTVDQSGSCGIVVTQDQQLRFTAFHPFGGELLVHYMNKDKIEVLNHDEELFVQLDNTPENRQKIQLPIHPEIVDLLEVLWGRKIISLNNDLKFSYKNDQPSLLEKNGLNIKIKRWIEYKGVLFPRLIVIKDAKRKTSIKLAITEFTPGTAEKVKIEKIPEGYKSVFALQ